MFKPTLKIRSQLLIDQQVQLPILQRTAFYLSACALYFMVILYFSEATQLNDESPSRTLWRCADVLACWAPGLMLLAPIIVYDVLIITNRFAGPMYRLRREMQLLISGESDRPIKLRDDDYWTEFANSFNAIRDELIALRELKSGTTKRLFNSAEAQLPGAGEQDSGGTGKGESETPAARQPSADSTEAFTSI